MRCTHEDVPRRTETTLLNTGGSHGEAGQEERKKKKEEKIKYYSPYSTL